MKFEDLTGARFGLAVAEKYYQGSNGNSGKWEYRCDCGNKSFSTAYNLKYRVKSCGCTRQENILKSKITHGKSKERIYGIWCAMKARCYRKSSISFKNYGGRGIEICKEWLDFSIFHHWSLSNGYSEELSIDRIKNDQGYYPGNCRWSNRLIQSRNRRGLVLFTHNEMTLCVSEWASIYNIKATTLHKRIKSMSFQEAITKPVLTK